MKIVSLGICCLLWSPGFCAARMYQWIDQQSGTVHMSGKAPGWYRSGNGGARVLVFENGRLVDDTARGVLADELNALRNEASVADELPDRGEPIDAQARTDESGADADGRQAEILKELTSHSSAVSARSNTRSSASEDAAAVERLKAIITDWEQRQTEGARTLIEAQEAQDPGAALQP